MKRLSKTQCEALLSAHERMLVLFSGDQRLVYSPYEEGDTFVLRPDQQKVLVPLSFFEDNEGRENRLLFHLYQTLALYPDWQKSPSAYLHRLNNYNHEIETAAKAYLEKVKEDTDSRHILTLSTCSSDEEELRTVVITAYQMPEE